MVDEQNVDVGELPTDTDLLLEAVEALMGPRFTAGLGEAIREEGARAFNQGVERGKFQMRPLVKWTSG